MTAQVGDVQNRRFAVRGRRPKLAAIWMVFAACFLGLGGVGVPLSISQGDPVYFVTSVLLFALGLSTVEMAVTFLGPVTVVASDEGLRVDALDRVIRRRLFRWADIQGFSVRERVQNGIPVRTAMVEFREGGRKPLLGTWFFGGSTPTLTYKQRVKLAYGQPDDADLWRGEPSDAERLVDWLRSLTKDIPATVDIVVLPPPPAWALSDLPPEPASPALPPPPPQPSWRRATVGWTIVHLFVGLGIFLAMVAIANCITTLAHRDASRTSGSADWLVVVILIVVIRAWVLFVRRRMSTAALVWVLGIAGVVLCVADVAFSPVAGR